MGLRWFCILAVCFGLAPEAIAGEQPGVFQRASCTVVRYYVAKYSASAAETWARSKGGVGWCQGCQFGLCRVAICL